MVIMIKINNINNRAVHTHTHTHTHTHVSFKVVSTFTYTETSWVRGGGREAGSVYGTLGDRKC